MRESAHSLQGSLHLEGEGGKLDGALMGVAGPAGRNLRSRQGVGIGEMGNDPFVRISPQFVSILVAFAAYAAALIYRSSFVVDGTRYFCLQDDPMISMRYAANLAHGYGLVWNPGGPHVEGYTNLLWTLYMAALHLLPIAPSKMSLAVQITGAVLLLVNLMFVRKIALLAFGSETASLVAVALTAFYFPLDNWALRGSEVAVLTPITSVAAWMTLLYLQRGRGTLLPLHILLGFATLVRFDMAALAVAVMLWIAFMERAPIHVRVRHLFLGGLVLISFMGAQVAFQIHYYGQPLPNTYYLKLTGYPLLPRLTRGFLVAAAFCAENAVMLLLIFYSGIFRRFRSSISFLVFLFATQVLYSIYVGGDAWEFYLGSNRYISIVMPLVMVVASYSLELWLKRPAFDDSAKHPPTTQQYRTRSLLINVLLLILVVNAGMLSNFLLLRSPPETQENHTLVQEALLVRQVTLPAARIAVLWAGSLIYFADRTGIDLLGKNDFKIAHESAHVKPGLSRWFTFRPGHMKWDYSYSIGQLKPDVVLQLWQWTPVQPDLARDYKVMVFPGHSLVYYMYVRRGTPNILWDRIAPLEEVQKLPLSRLSQNLH